MNGLQSVATAQAEDYSTSGRLQISFEGSPMIY